MAKVLRRCLLAAGALSFLLAGSGWAGENGPAGWWKFDEGQGIIAKDSSGKGNDGRITGAEYVKVNNGFALKFNGAGSCVTVANNPGLNFGAGAFTVMAWVKVPLVPKQWQNIVDKRQNKGGKGFDFQISEGGAPALEVNDGSYGIAYGKAKVPSDTWCHLAVVCDRETDTLFYLNGKQAGLGDLSARSDSLDGASDIIIGSNRGYPVAGLIDEVRIYTRVLSAAEITKIYESSQP